MHVTPEQGAADLSVPGVAYITHFMFSASFPVIYSTCNTFSRKSKAWVGFFCWFGLLFFFSVKLSAGFSLLPRNSWSLLLSPAWPKDQGGRKTPPRHFHLQDRCKGFSGHGENPSLPCPAPGWCQLPSHTNIQPGGSIPSSPKVTQPIPKLPKAQDAPTTRCKWPLNP